MKRNEAAPLLGARVVASIDGSVRIAKLKFLPPDGTAVFADERGVESRVPLESLLTLTDARTPCDVCGGKHNVVFDTDDGQTLCADHKRDWSQRQPPRQEVCPNHPDRPAILSPRTKKFRCPQCHMLEGGMSGLSAEARALQALAAECKGKDLQDTRHVWFHVRGHRYHCVACPAKRFTDPPPGTLFTK